MAISITITPKELERQATASLVGKGWRMFLANDPSSTLTATATVSAWEALRVAEANGYADQSGTIASGSYNSTAGRYELSPLVGTFNATGTGYAYNVIVLCIVGSDYPHSIMRLSAQQSLQAGQSRSYYIKLLQDD